MAHATATMSGLLSPTSPRREEPHWRCLWAGSRDAIPAQGGTVIESPMHEMATGSQRYPRNHRDCPHIWWRGVGCRTGFYVSDDTNAPPPMETERTLADRGDGRGMTGAPKRRVSGQASLDAPCRTSRGHEEQQCRARRRMRSARQTEIDRLAECNRWPHLSTMAHEPHTLLPQMPPGELNRKSALAVRGRMAFPSQVPRNQNNNDEIDHKRSVASLQNGCRVRLNGGVARAGEAFCINLDIGIGRMTAWLPFVPKDGGSSALTSAAPLLLLACKQ